MPSPLIALISPLPSSRDNFLEKEKTSSFETFDWWKRNSGVSLKKKKKSSKLNYHIDKLTFNPIALIQSFACALG